MQENFNVEDLESAEIKGVKDQNHLKKYNYYKEDENLNYSIPDLFSKGVFSPTLEKYRNALKKSKLDKRKIKTVQEKQNYENEYEKGSFLSFIEEKEEEENNKKEQKQGTEDIFGNAQEKAFFKEKEQKETEENIEELNEQREDFAEFFTLISDSLIKGGIKKFTKYKFTETKHTQKRVQGLEKTVLKLMHKYSYKPSFWEELAVHFSFYGLDVVKGLELKEQKENNSKEKTNLININRDDEFEKRISNVQDLQERKIRKRIKEKTQIIKKEDKTKKINSKGIGNIINE